MKHLLLSAIGLTLLTGCLDTSDNTQEKDPSTQTDTSAHLDSDNDGVLDSVDAFPQNAQEWSDLDQDGTGDNSDLDIDGDNINNADDVYPEDQARWNDSDISDANYNALCDCILPPNDYDNDGIMNQEDAFPNDPLEWSDLDQDGTGDNSDLDIDGDNINNADDVYPEDKARWNDTDITDVNYNALCDCLVNPLSDLDDDGYLDAHDAFPNDPTEWLDLDGDGIGNNKDTDLDGDGADNDEDLYPFNPNEYRDLDQDGIPDGQDEDDDNDLHLDVYDDFPFDENEYLDTDHDGIGNNVDSDIDGDGLENGAHIENSADAIAMGLDGNDDGDSFNNDSDKMPHDHNELFDFDQDGLGDNEDTDDDNDGYLDSEDAYSTNPNEWADFDGDKLGDNEDLDDDNDGVNDVEDPAPFDADVPNLSTNLCATPDVELVDINTLVDFINAMPKPLDLPCFVQALPRPLFLNATSGTISAQPAVGERNPRSFIVYNQLILSVVTDYDLTREGQLLEMSFLLSDTRSLKAELIFPIEETINYGTPFDHIRSAGISLCGTCHANEVVHEFRDGIEVYASDALKPYASKSIKISDMRDERNMCDSATEPYRCSMYQAIFDHGTIINYAFPDAMLEFL